MLSEKFDEYIDSHSKECVRLVVLLVTSFWQTPVTIFGLILYGLLIKRFNLNRFVITTISIVVALELLWTFHDIHQLILAGWQSNKLLWNSLIQGNFIQAFSFQQLELLIGFSPLLMSILSLIDLISSNPYQKEMQALQKGQLIVTSEINNKKTEMALAKIKDEAYDGTVLGVSKYTGKCIVIPDRHINQVLLTLGTTGSGKTITLRRFYQRAILRGYPLIIVDGKPDAENIARLMKLAEKHGRKFFGFNCGNNLSYDPLANGGYTELKDKIISLKDEWSSDHYRSIAEDYLQATFEVLLRSGKNFDLKKVVECLNYDDLKELARSIGDERLLRRVNCLERYDREDITGLQAHLNILIHSELGQFFEKNVDTFTLVEVIQQNAVVYFALPALRFPSFAKVLGKLVINDLKAVIDRDHGKRVFTVFDEFSVFAGEQVLNLVNMGRGKGVHAIFGTQGLADLDKVDMTFKNQMLNCVNTLICHRLNDQESAETAASWIGTKEAFTVTAQLNSKDVNSGMGSVRVNKEFIIHPDAIKQELQTGEIFYITKVGGFSQDKVRIKFV